MKISNKVLTKISDQKVLKKISEKVLKKCRTSFAKNPKKIDENFE
jgi:hypothetical protein